MRRDDSTGEPVTTIETDTVTTSTAVHLDLTGIGLEACCGIFSGDTALDGETAGGDAVLGQAKLLQGRTRRDLDLGSNDL